MTEYKGKKNIEEALNIVIRYIRDILRSGEVSPGERLPAERKLAEDTGVSRAKVRLALERLESYGVVKTLPQSGTVLSDHSRTALLNQMNSIIDSINFDFASLVNVRTLLEAESVRLCALNHTDEDIEVLRAAFQDFADNQHTPLRDEKDFAFHTAIARCSHNPVIYNLLLMITPDVLSFYRRLSACAVPVETVLEEHRTILELIEKGDAEAASQALRNHFSDIMNFAANNPCEVPRARI